MHYMDVNLLAVLVCAVAAMIVGFLWYSPVLFAGAQPQFAGLYQINVQIPVSVRGPGEVQVVFTVDGQTTNTSTINIR